MTKMVVTNRQAPLVVRTALGLSFVFKPGEPVDVHENYVEECMKAGVGFVDPQEEPNLPGNVPKPVSRVPSASELHTQLVELFRKIAQEPQTYRNAFTAAGRPQVKWASDKIGYDVTSEMVTAAWSVVLEERGASAA